VDAERILGVRVDATSYADATERILAWAKAGESRFVCAANVHVVMEAHDSPDFAAALEKASLVTPDGMPLVWYMRATLRGQSRVYGPTLMLCLCEAAAREAVPIALVGATGATLDLLCERLAARYPGLRVAFRCAPSFGEIGEEEDARIVEGLASSGARIVLVGLGCPKQERWMAAHLGRVQAPMIGVGAAFDFHSGRVRQAPALLQKAGLEWLFRLAHEPRRLASRYLKHNPRFAALALREILARKAGW
jgi:N-acetylglucosaminyldiphosphoundecaprenol N-acetyl-beta-D-mannosaminyltransferase